MGTTKEIKEADVKQYARKMFKDKGYYSFPVNQGMFSRAGIPDDCLCVGGNFYAVEFKSELRWGNKATLPRPTQVLEMNKIWAAGGAAFVVDRYRLAALATALSHDTIFYFAWHQAFREIDPKKWDCDFQESPSDIQEALLAILYPPVFRDTAKYVAMYNAEKWECPDYNSGLPVSKNRILGVRQYDMKWKY